MKRSACILAALLVVGGTGPVVAQDCAVGIKPPAAGSWAEYTTAEGTMRMAILGNETRGGKNLVRMEMSMSSRQGPMIIQVLVPGYPYESRNIEDFVVKAGNNPPMRMSAQMMNMMRSQMPRDAIADACRNNRMTRVGAETITVAAGTFATVHYRDSEGNDVWVSESVPFGLVKTTLAKGGSVELAGKGGDAKSQITEEPQEMRMPGQ